MRLIVRVQVIKMSAGNN